MIPYLLALSLLAGPCPIGEWRDCHVMPETVKERVRQALDNYTVETPRCMAAKDAVMEWLALPVVWTYERHTGDDSHKGLIQGGNTLRDKAGKPVGLGFHLRALRQPDRVLARIMLHEGAHIRWGRDEAMAQAVDRACVRSAFGGPLHER